METGVRSPRLRRWNSRDLHRRRGAAIETVTVQLAGRSYRVLLGDGLLSDFSSLVDQHSRTNRYAVITDSNVGPMYGGKVLAEFGNHDRCSLFQFPAGEQHKTRETWQSITDQMLAAGFGRDTTVIALGGGVVGDLAGFVAATFLRGVPLIQVPTSLLAMIDSSVGGKTGVDTVHGKNLVGAFHQPMVVIADVATIATLPAAHVSAGMAEAIKHGVVADAAYFRRLVGLSDRVLERDATAITELVKRSVEIKADVVSEDEREQGKRAVLNFGHTIGHALEAVSGYELLHGEAVAQGMLAEAELGIRLAITDAAVLTELKEALSAMMLPTELDMTAEPATLLKAMEQDKKNRHGSVRFALPERLGKMARDPGGSWTCSAPEPVVTGALAHLFKHK